MVTPPPGLKDLNGLWHAVGHDKADFLARLNTLLAAARPASRLRAEAFSTEAGELMERCRPLLDDPLLLDKAKTAIAARGYAGDTTAPILGYLSLTSRLLERPLNLAFVAPSGAGKNRAVDAALELVPEDAYCLEKAGSARALVYSPTSFEHKVVIVSEADSIPQDEGSAASAIRSLAEDGYMTYDYVAPDAETGAFVTRRITKPGPTGLITTSTRPLKEQLSTRTFSVPINDGPNQTREVMRVHAAKVSGSLLQVDIADFVDLQRWLALAGNREVTVPFAGALADLVPATHVRMRRDFRQLLTIIQAVALLYQRQRQRDEQGCIVATLDDYRQARDLVLSVFTAAASGGVTPQVRQTAEGLQNLHRETHEPVTRKALGDGLGLATDTIWHRVQRAIELGYIVNQETRERQPAKLVPGDPLPEDEPALPTPEEVAAYMCAGQVKTGSIVQSDAPSQTRAESDSAIESASESPVQTDIQTPADVNPDSEATSLNAPIERLNEEGGAPHTSEGSAYAEKVAPPASEGRCRQTDCDSELWAYAPDSSPLCKTHYEIVQRSALVTAATEQGARLLGIKIPAASQVGAAAGLHCSGCGRGLSMKDERGICRGCSAASLRATNSGGVTKGQTSNVEGPHHELASLLGLALVALHKCGHPKMGLADGRNVGPGLDAWAPVLRAMDGDELRDLLRQVDGRRG